MAEKYEFADFNSSKIHCCTKQSKCLNTSSFWKFCFSWYKPYIVTWANSCFKRSIYAYIEKTLLQHKRSVLFSWSLDSTESVACPYKHETKSVCIWLLKSHTFWRVIFFFFFISKWPTMKSLCWSYTSMFPDVSLETFSFWK